MCIRDRNRPFPYHGVWLEFSINTRRRRPLNEIRYTTVGHIVVTPAPPIYSESRHSRIWFASGWRDHQRAAGHHTFTLSRQTNLGLVRTQYEDSLDSVDEGSMTATPFGYIQEFAYYQARNFLNVWRRLCLPPSDISVHTDNTSKKANIIMIFSVWILWQLVKVAYCCQYFWNLENTFETLWKLVTVGRLHKYKL